MPKITFVVPIYNKEAYIAQCLDSLINQTLKDIEILCVNDGSTDGCIDILKWYKAKDNRIVIHDFVKNQGRSIARNIGNYYAKSDIICVNDADDISLPNRAKLTYNYFNNNDVDLVYGQFYFTDKASGHKALIGATKWDWDRNKSNLYNYICHSTMAYKKDMVNNIQYSRGEWSDLGIEDWKIQVDYHMRGLKFGCINKPLVYYEQFDNSISKNRDEVKIKEIKRRYLNEES